MSINIISSNKLHKADAIIRPFCTNNVKRLFMPGIKVTNSRKDFFKYEIKASFPIYSLKNGKEKSKERFKKYCIKCLKAVAEKDCETVIIDLKLPDNLNNLQKVVYNEVVDAATAFLSKTDMDILLFVGNGNFILSNPVLLSRISSSMEAHFGCRIDDLYDKKSNNEYAFTQPFKSIPDDDDDYCSFGNLSSGKCVSINYSSINNKDIKVARNDIVDDDDCSFGEFSSKKRSVVDCFGASGAEIEQNGSDNEDLYYIADSTSSETNCFSFGGEADQNNEDPKYKDSDIDLLSGLNFKRHLHTDEIKTIVKVIMDKYNPDEYFGDRLMQLIDSKGMDPRTVYQKANISRQTWSKIRNDPTHRPDKKTIISFAFALELTFDETQELLNSVGLALSDCFVFDFIVMHFLKNGIYNISALNEALHDLKQKTLNN